MTHVKDDTTPRCPDDALVDVKLTDISVKVQTSKLTDISVKVQLQTVPKKTSFHRSSIDTQIYLQSYA